MLWVSNNNNRHGNDSSSDGEECHENVSPSNAQEGSARHYESWLRGNDDLETPPMVTTSLEEQEREQTRRMTRTLYINYENRIV